MNLSVIQTENLDNDQAALGCYISVNNQLIDIITPISHLDHENFTEIPDTGIVEFLIKDMRKDEVVGVLLQNIEDLPKKAEKWFELNSNLQPAPKILISSKAKNQVFNSVNHSPKKEDLMQKINELSTTVLELECRLGLEKEEKHKEIISKTKLIQSIQSGSGLTIEQLKIKLNNAFSLIEEFSLDKENLLKLCSIEHEKTRVYDMKIRDLKEKYEEIIEKIRCSERGCMQENCLLQDEVLRLRQDLNKEMCLRISKEAVISQLSCRMNNLNDFEYKDQDITKRVGILERQVESLEIEKSALKDMLEGNEHEKVYVEECGKCQEMMGKIGFLEGQVGSLQVLLAQKMACESLTCVLKSKIVNQDEEIKRLKGVLDDKNREIQELNEIIRVKTFDIETVKQENEEIVQESSELKRRIIIMNKNIDMLEREIMDRKCQNISERKIEKIKLDEIDSILESYLSEQGIENLFVKMAHGVYLYGTKRVNIDTKNDNRLICRTGGGYMPIDQFLKLYQNTDIEDISKYVKKQSLFLSQGRSPLRNLHKRAASSTPENTSRRSSPKENFTERNFENKIIEKLKVVYPLRDRNRTPVLNKINK